jgi:hypothetical protein
MDKPELFCDCQLVGKDDTDKENIVENVLLCCAHLSEGRCFVCPYDSLKAAKTRNARGGCCEDATAVKPVTKPTETECLGLVMYEPPEKDER